MKTLLKWVFVVVVVVPVMLVVVTAIVGAVMDPRSIQHVEAMRAEQQRAAQTVTAPPARAAVKKAEAEAPARVAPCQVVTDLAPLRPAGQNLCAAGTYSKVEISLEDGELLVQGDLNMLGMQIFRTQKGKVFGTSRDFVDHLHTAAPRITQVSYQLFDASTTSIVGTCWHMGGVTRCKDYSGPTPKFVQ
jgi:hypothetical protein